MEADRVNRLLPLTGALFVVAFVVANAITGSMPDENSSAQKVFSYWHGHQGVQTASAFLGAFAMLLFLFFAGTLRSALQSRESEGVPFATIAFGGAVVTAAAGAIDSMLRLATASAADNGAGSAVYTLNQLTAYDWLPAVTGLSVMLIASGLAGLMTSVLPRWLSWTGLVIGLAFLTPAGIIAFFGFPLWILAASIALYGRGRSVRRTIAPAASRAA
jgi:hypothetical protein